MILFKKEGNSLKEIQEMKFSLERDLQGLTEGNLGKVFNLEFVCSEFSLNNLRIDTLAFDRETKSFVIIEYKRDKHSQVIDQGFAYLALMVNNKAEFILQYIEKMKENLRREDVDWQQSRVIFVSHSFTTHQRKAIEFKDLPIELWEARRFGKDLILFSEIKPSNARESIRTITKDKVINSVSSQVKKYTVEDHFKDGWEKSLEIYQSLKDRILAMDERIEESPKKIYIGFKIGNKVVCGVHVQKSKIVLWLGKTEPKDLKDPEKRVTYRKKSYEHYNQHISDFYLENEDDIDYAMFLIRQVYEKFFKK